LLLVAVLAAAGMHAASTADDRPDFENGSQETPVGAEQSVSGFMVKRRQQHMGTWLEISTWAADRSRAMVASEAAFTAVADADRRLSTWREDSELAVANGRGPHRPVKLSSLLVRDLSQALSWHRETAGAFSPGLGALVSAWDLRGRGRVPTNSELHTALADSALAGTMIDDSTIWFGQPGLQFEEGGFGKGVALRDGVTAALESGSHCVILDFGGQITVGGHCDSVTIGISDPDDRRRVVGLLSVTKGSVATSGLSERHFVANDVRYGHIVDPRTGSPAPDWGSVTVLSQDPTAADCISTALFVMGPESGMTWVNRHPEVEAVFNLRTDAGLRLMATPGLVGHLTPMEDLSLEWFPRVDARPPEPPISALPGD